MRSGVVLYVKDLDRVAAFYAALFGFAPVGRDEGHVLLESPAFQLVILRMPNALASTIHITVPPVRRDQAAIKLVFWVSSIAEVRASAPAWGGSLNGAATEWVFNGSRVCDGLDPEGNVIQVREDSASP